MMRKNYMPYIIKNGMLRKIQEHIYPGLEKDETGKFVDTTYAFINLKIKDHDPYQIRNMKIGDTITLMEIHHYHDINGSCHYFVPYQLGDEEISYSNDPFDGESYSGGIYTVTRINETTLKINTVDGR